MKQMQLKVRDGIDELQIDEESHVYHRASVTGRCRIVS